MCVSHDSSFLNEFVDYIIHLHGSTLTTYKGTPLSFVHVHVHLHATNAARPTGDYDTFVKVRAANRAAKKKKAEAQEKKKEQIKKFAERSRDKQVRPRDALPPLLDIRTCAQTRTRHRHNHKYSHGHSHSRSHTHTRMYFLSLCLCFSECACCRARAA